MEKGMSLEVVFGGYHIYYLSPTYLITSGEGEVTAYSFSYSRGLLLLIYRRRSGSKKIAAICCHGDWESY
jgi:hypothetical protein